MYIYAFYVCINTYVYIYIYICHLFVKYDVFGQCKWGTSCRSRRELSNAIVKSDFRKAGVEIWPFPFRNWVFKGSLGLPGGSLEVPGWCLGFLGPPGAPWSCPWGPQGGPYVET